VRGAPAHRRLDLVSRYGAEPEIYKVTLWQTSAAESNWPTVFHDSAGLPIDESLSDLVHGHH